MYGSRSLWIHHILRSRTPRGQGDDRGRRVRFILSLVDRGPTGPSRGRRTTCEWSSRWCHWTEDLNRRGSRREGVETVGPVPVNKWVPYNLDRSKGLKGEYRHRLGNVSCRRPLGWGEVSTVASRSVLAVGPLVTVVFFVGSPHSPTFWWWVGTGTGHERRPVHPTSTPPPFTFTGNLFIYFST